MCETISKHQRQKITLRILPFEGDLAAEQRVRTILELAIIIGKRNQVIGNHIPDVQNSCTQLIKNKEG